MASRGHVRKRQIQQQSLDSYIDRHSPNSGLRRQREEPLTPSLPDETQASLLSVGMRVRKSVPEGYKTHKTIGLPSVRLPSTASVTPSVSRAQAYNTTRVEGARELAPFCGLHKTGGLAPQNVTSSAPARMQPYNEAAEDEDDLPDSMFSQSTLQSTQDSFGSWSSSAQIPGRKRTYEDDIEDDLDSFFDDDTAMDSVRPTALRLDRPLASMRQSLSRRSAQKTETQVFGVDDFEDASFLGPQGMDVDDF